MCTITDSVTMVSLLTFEESHYCVQIGLEAHRDTATPHRL